MDPFSKYEMADPVEIPSKSAFGRYRRGLERWNCVGGGSSSHGNLHKRMMESLRAIGMGWDNGGDNRSAEAESNRGHRHMINERQRREKMRLKYKILHSMLPPLTKGYKNSIVKMAALHLHQLQGLKDKLERRRSELEERVRREAEILEEVTKINLRVRNPSSSIDSMLGVLRCLKSMKLKARKVASKFSDQEFCAILDFETKEKIPTTEVEKVVEDALIEVERNFVR